MREREYKGEEQDDRKPREKWKRFLCKIYSQQVKDKEHLARLH